MSAEVESIAREETGSSPAEEQTRSKMDDIQTHNRMGDIKLNAPDSAKPSGQITTLEEQTHNRMDDIELNAPDSPKPSGQITTLEEQTPSKMADIEPTAPNPITSGQIAPQSLNEIDQSDGSPPSNDCQTFTSCGGLTDSNGQQPSLDEANTVVSEKGPEIYEEKPPRIPECQGSLRITLPQSAVDESRNRASQVICLEGSCSRSDSDQISIVQVYLETGEDCVSLSLYANAMGALFQDQLTEQWNCILTKVITPSEENPQHPADSMLDSKSEDINQQQDPGLDRRSQDPGLVGGSEIEPEIPSPALKENAPKRKRGRPKGSGVRLDLSSPQGPMKSRRSPTERDPTTADSALTDHKSDSAEGLTKENGVLNNVSLECAESHGLVDDSPSKRPTRKRGRPFKYRTETKKNPENSPAKKARSKERMKPMFTCVKTEGKNNSDIFTIEGGESLKPEDSDVNENNNISRYGSSLTDILSSDAEEPGKYRHKVKTDRKLNTKLYARNKIVAESMDYDTSDGAQICIICSNVHSLGFHLLVHLRRFHVMTPKDYLELLQLKKEEREKRIYELKNLAHIPEKKQFPKRAGSLACDYCGEFCIGIQNMKHHLMLAHRTEKDLAKKMEYYKAAYSRLIHANRMIAMRKENQVKDYPCRYCGLVLAMASTRSRHQMYSCPKNPNRLKRIHCNFCGTSFRTQEILAKHQKKHAAHDFKYVCDICGKVCKSKPMMYEHKMIVHKGRPPKYACPHPSCDKAFQYKDQLKNHVVKHSDKRDFMCDLCGKFFKTTSDVAKHTKFVHEGIYPYHCEKCGHGVAKVSYLMSHKCGRVRRIKTNINDQVQCKLKQGSSGKSDQNLNSATKQLDNGNGHSFVQSQAGYSNHIEPQYYKTSGNIQSVTSQHTPLQQYTVLPNQAHVYPVEMHSHQSLQYANEHNQLAAFIRQQEQMMPEQYQANHYQGNVSTGLIEVYPVTSELAVNAQHSDNKDVQLHVNPTTDYSKYTQFHLPPHQS